MIFDGPNKLATHIGDVYGDSNVACFHLDAAYCANNKLVKSISTSGRKMYLEFRRESIYKQQKAEVLALIKYNKFMPECQTWLDLTNKVLKSPNEYGYNFNCNWLLSYEIGSYIILRITHIDVSSDFLSKIYYRLF